MYAVAFLAAFPLGSCEFLIIFCFLIPYISDDRLRYTELKMCDEGLRFYIDML